MIVAAVCPQGGGAVCVRSQSEPELPAETHEEAGQQQPERPADICQWHANGSYILLWCVLVCVCVWLDTGVCVRWCVFVCDCINV